MPETSFVDSLVVAGDERLRSCVRDRLVGVDAEEGRRAAGAGEIAPPEAIDDNLRRRSMPVRSCPLRASAPMMGLTCFLQRSLHSGQRAPDMTALPRPPTGIGLMSRSWSSLVGSARALPSISGHRKPTSSRSNRRRSMRS